MNASSMRMTASGAAVLRAVKRKAERFGRIALMSSFVSVLGMFGGPFLCGLSVGLAAASVVALSGFLWLADACDASTLLAEASETDRPIRQPIVVFTEDEIRAALSPRRAEVALGSLVSRNRSDLSTPAPSAPSGPGADGLERARGSTRQPWIAIVRTWLRALFARKGAGR